MMNFIEAKQEFKIRYYLWATSEFEREIDEALPNLKLFKVGSCWETYRFMQELDKGGQLLLGRSLLKRFHPEAVKVLGESCSIEEKLLRDRLDRFHRDAKLVEINSQKGDREKIKFVSKGKLRKTMAAKFTKAYGDRCVKNYTGNDWDPWFEMKVAGWIVSTRFSFGRRESMISYYHSIESEAKVPNPEFPPEFWMPSMRLEHLISFASWLGICSQTEWVSLVEGDVDQACDSVIKCCGQFFEAVPQLLKGLEFDKITVELDTPTIARMVPKKK